MRTFFLLAVLLVATCDSDPATPSCDGQGVVTGAVITGRSDLLVDKDLLVRGVASDASGLTIRRVLVAGIAATNDGFNFERWSVTLPIDLLASLPRAQDGAVMIKVEAIDTCETHFALETFVVNVDSTPGVRVSQLAISAAVAGDQDYLPANGATAAILTFTANADAAHAVVSLAASVGTFVGTTGGQVTLEGDGAAPATATVLFSATTPTSQPALITASAKGTVASTTVRIAGPPTLIPGSATLAPGQAVAVTVTTSGAVQACQATPAAGLTITSGGLDLMAAPGGADTTGDHLVDIVAVAAANLTAPAISTVTCRDPYGQFATAEIRAAPP